MERLVTFLFNDDIVEFGGEEAFTGCQGSLLLNYSNTMNVLQNAYIVAVY